jgi:hypothetical protein
MVVQHRRKHLLSDDGPSAPPTFCGISRSRRASLSRGLFNEMKRKDSFVFLEKKASPQASSH